MYRPNYGGYLLDITNVVFMGHIAPMIYVCRDCGVKLVEAEIAINNELCVYCLQLDDREEDDAKSKE